MHSFWIMLGYDPEAHAEKAVEALLTGAELRNAQTGVTRDVVRQTRQTDRHPVEGRPSMSLHCYYQTSC